MKNNNVKELVKQGICPVCNATLAHQESCVECAFCGWSLCSEA